MQAFLNWLDHRTGYKALVHEALYERIPGGARWRYVWGSTLVFTFFVQCVTGFFLWTAYSPSSQTAWESVYYIQYVMSYGWLVRGLHHFTAQAMIVLLVLHLMQVVIDGAYKAPREVNFWLGLILMKIVLGLSLTGYLLPWDQKGYWATQVATNIAGITPFVGPELQKLAVGGPDYGHHTLTRFFALHAGLLPALLVFFLALHIAVFRRHGITVPDPHRAPEATFWPDQVLKDAVACLAVLAAVLALTVWKGAELSAPADPAEPYQAARPEWYFLFLFQFLKLFPSSLEAVGAIYVPGAVMLVFFLMPFIAKWDRGHRFNVRFVFGLMGACTVLTLWAVISDTYYDPDYRRAVLKAEHDAERVRELAAGQGIGVSGAIDLLRNDPKTQGPRLFAENCGICHRWNGEDGNGGKPAEKPTATDLAKFGTREWIRAVITDFKGHMAPTANDPAVGDRFLTGSMADWSEENGAKFKPDELDALVEFLFAQSQRDDLGPVKAGLLERGQEIFEIGTDDVTESCLGCHSMQVAGAAAPIEGGGDTGPNLTGYGSRDWLRSFVDDPGTRQHYGSKRNAMPAFKDRMSESDRRMLVDWMLGRWFEPAAAE